MNIVFLAPFGIRPKGTVIARMLPLAAALQELGHRVTIIAPPYTNPEDAGHDEVLRGVRLRNVCLGPGGRALSAPAVAWRMYRATMDEQPDLVHLFKPKGYGGLAALLLRYLQRKLPLWVDTDDWEGKGGMNERLAYSSLEKRIYSWQERSLLALADGVTVASRALEQIVQQRVPVSGRLMYLPNCVDNQAPGDGTKVRERYRIPADAPVVLLYTRFFEFEQNRLHTVLEDIFQRVPSVRFLVVGTGRAGEEQQLAAAACERGFSEALNIVGWIEPEQLREYLAAGDVALYPFADTLVNRCKCPAKLTELLLAGIPVVADRVGQIPEYLVQDSGGILCHSGDIMAMVNGAVTLIEDHPTRVRMGEFNRRHIRERFDWKKRAVDLAALYEDVSSLRMNHTGSSTR